MSERIAQTILLLRSRDWFDYQPPVSTGQMIRTNTRAQAGEGNEQWIDCPACGGQGKRRMRGIWSACSRCEGRALILVDQYTRREIGSEETGVKKGLPRSIPCDACLPLDPKAERGTGFLNGERCRHCDGSGRTLAFQQRIRPFRRPSELVDVLLERTERTGDPRLDAMLLRAKLGSYDELEKAMGALRLHDLYAFREVAALEADRRSLIELRYHARVMAGLDFLVRRMPDPIRVPAAVIAADRRLQYDKRKKSRREAA